MHACQGNRAGIVWSLILLWPILDRPVLPGFRPTSQVFQQRFASRLFSSMSRFGHIPPSWRDYNNGSRREGIDRKALFRADVSFPPASAKSGLPPPEPPTCLASAWISLPAWTLEVRSLVTPAIRATLPSLCITDAATTE